MDALEFQKDFLEEVKSTAAVAGEGSTVCICKHYDRISNKL